MVLGLHNVDPATLAQRTNCPGLTRRDVGRFWEKVQKSPGCWLWTASITGGKPGREYGQFAVTRLNGGGQHRFYAHRFAWMLAHGPIPEGFEICHSCDQPRCVNVAHMRLGTRLDNMGDAASRGRLHVSRPSRQKLTTKQLLEIDALLATGERGIKTAIAKSYGVSKAWVSSYANGKRRQYDRPVHHIASRGAA